MHLLHVGTHRLEEFFDPVPAYAVLSHKWDVEELTFQEVRAGADDAGVRGKRGYAKLAGCCAQAARDGLDYVWIDTCCIDKTSSAELSEAINSMFAWYANARECYVYLGDVPATDRPHAPGSAFRRSLWFTRGWTLQELIAPRARRFFARSWDPVRFGQTDGGGGGDDDPATLAFELPRLLEDITRVPHTLLSRGFADVAAFSVAERLSWAAGRATSRPEDRAYCLLGLLGVNMPLLYGEGGPRAFFRLQQVFIQNSSDQTLLCWASSRLLDPDGQLLAWTGGLAPSPDYFLGCDAQSRGGDTDRPIMTGRWAGQPYSIIPRDPVEHSLVTNRGLAIYTPLCSTEFERGVCLAAVEAYSGREGLKRLAIPLIQSRHSTNVFHRLPGGRPVRLSSFEPINWSYNSIYLGLQDHCPDRFAPVGVADDFWWADVAGPLCSSEGPWRFDGMYPPIPAAKQKQSLRLGHARLVELPDDLLLVFSNPSRTLLVWFHVKSTIQQLWQDGNKTIPLVQVSIAETETPGSATNPAESASQRLSEAPVGYVLEPGGFGVDFEAAFAKYEWSDATKLRRAAESDFDSTDGSFEQKFESKLVSVELNIQLA